MFEKPEIKKENILKIVVALIVASVILLTLSILTDDNDSRSQISDNDGATETTLCNILSEVKGVGDVNVMIQYDDESKVSGVIVTAEGAHDPVVKNDVIKGVSALFDIPVSSVMVFEKNQEEKSDE